MRSSIPARLARGFLATRPARVSWPGGVISFTFDDFPKSALTSGGAILERYGLRGTYYASLGMAGSENHLGPMFEHEDLRAAHDAGHEIACHTYTHRDCCRATGPAIVAEIAENGAALAGLLGGVKITNFAYPYGAVSLAGKRVLSTCFDTCRGVGQGANYGIVDLADLLAVRIYNRGFDRAALRRTIDRNRALGGWIIFFTHDVSVKPSDFGCTPSQLEAIVADAAERAPVLPVRDVVAGLAQFKPTGGGELRPSLGRFWQGAVRASPPSYR
jgi:peptidoglycan/xylan/chitin deacetylase (PgdA/CDA1 family)